MVVGGVLFLMGCWPVDPSFLLTVGQRPSSFPFYESLCRGSSKYGRIASRRVNKQEKSERGTYLNSEAGTHRFCHITFVQSSSLGVTHTQGLG